MEPLNSLRNKGGEITSEVRERSMTYIAGGLGIVVGLACFVQDVNLLLTFEVVQESLIMNLYEKHDKNTQIRAFESCRT